MIRRAFRFVRNFIRDLFARDPSAKKEVHPDFVKALLPMSGFTKRGPGVVAHVLEVLRGMTQEQRQVCRDHGWDRGLLLKSSDGKLRC